MTDAQKWALQAIDDGFATSPSSLGERMMERPGAVPAWRGTVSYAAQGYGRMGGTMLARLERLGLCRHVRISEYQTRYAVTALGRAKLGET